MRVGVISDTHGLLRPEALQALEGADHILHAGDIGADGVVEALATVAPVTAIRGNVDTGAWAGRFPERTTVTLAGRRLHLVHDVNDLSGRPPHEGIDVVVSGHSHRPRVERIEGVLYLNPGSAGRRRFGLPVTLALVDLDGDEIRSRIVELVP